MELSAELHSPFLSSPRSTLPSSPYYLEKNLDARERELEREAELEEKALKVKAKSKLSKAEKEARKKQKMQTIFTD